MKDIYKEFYKFKAGAKSNKIKKVKMPRDSNGMFAVSCKDICIFSSICKLSSQQCSDILNGKQKYIDWKIKKESKKICDTCSKKDFNELNGAVIENNNTKLDLLLKIRNILNYPQNIEGNGFTYEDLRGRSFTLTEQIWIEVDNENMLVEKITIDNRLSNIKIEGNDIYKDIEIREVDTEKYDIDLSECSMDTLEGVEEIISIIDKTLYYREWYQMHNGIMEIEVNTLVYVLGSLKYIERLSISPTHLIVSLDDVVSICIDR